MESGLACDGIEAEYGAEFDYPDSLLEHRNPMTFEYLQRKLALETMILENIEKNSQNVSEESILSKARIARIQGLISRLEAEHE